ncbi:MAG TPA: hypothetical protein VHF90_00850 [Thermoleophilaceae bacterium]|nr:hypothetical protein [Thermoleophilaceae bacterium]
MNGSGTVVPQALGVLVALVGVAMVVSALTRGGGPLALGVVLGVLFALLGTARVWLARAQARARRAPR